MEPKKLGFMNINREKILNRDEMRSILAGSGGECALYCGSNCTIRCGITPCEVLSGAMTCQGQVITCANAHCP